MTANPGQAPIPVAASHLPGQDPVLEIKDLSVVYRTPGGDVRAVDKVNLDLAPGEVVGLAGESGSGKSTLVYGASRLLRAPALITSGSVTYAGRRVTKPVDMLRLRPDQLQRLRWREIAIVFQSAMNALNPVLNVRDQLLDVIHAHLRMPRDEARDRAASLLDLVGIPRSRLRSYPHELSGGMRQRVMIAMALALEPQVVIMDEPTTALDVVTQREIIEELMQLRHRLGFAVVFITHDLSLLLELADSIAIMYAGRLVEYASASDLFHAPRHPYSLGLLGSFPALHGERVRMHGIPGSPPSLRNLPSGCTFHVRCSFAMERCKTQEPPLAQPARSAHQRLASCWLQDGFTATPEPLALPDPEPAAYRGSPNNRASTELIGDAP